MSGSKVPTFGLETTGTPSRGGSARALQAVKTITEVRERRASASKVANSARSASVEVHRSVTTSAGQLRSSAASASRGPGNSTTSHPPSSSRSPSAHRPSTSSSTTNTVRIITPPRVRESVSDRPAGSIGQTLKGRFNRVSKRYGADRIWTGACGAPLSFAPKSGRSARKGRKGARDGNERNEGGQDCLSPGGGIRGLRAARPPRSAARGRLPGRDHRRGSGPDAGGRAQAREGHHRLRDRRGPGGRLRRVADQIGRA